MLIMIASEKQLAERHPVEKVWLQAIRLTAVKVRSRHWKKVFYFTKDVSAWVKDAWTYLKENHYLCERIEPGETVLAQLEEDGETIHLPDQQKLSLALVRKGEDGIEGSSAPGEALAALCGFQAYIPPPEYKPDVFQAVFNSVCWFWCCCGCFTTCHKWNRSKSTWRDIPKFCECCCFDYSSNYDWD